MSSSDTADARAASSRVPASCRAARRPQTRAHLLQHLLVSQNVGCSPAHTRWQAAWNARPAVFAPGHGPACTTGGPAPLAYTHACRDVSGRAGGRVGRRALGVGAGRPAHRQISRQRVPGEPCIHALRLGQQRRRLVAVNAQRRRPVQRGRRVALQVLPPARVGLRRAPRGVARHGAGGDIGHHAEVSLLCPYPPAAHAPGAPPARHCRRRWSGRLRMLPGRPARRASTCACRACFDRPGP